MTTQPIDIIVRERGSRVVKRNLRELGGTAKGAGSSVTFLRNALGGLTAGFVVRQLGRIADSFTGINNLLRITATETSSVSDQYSALLDIANRTRAPLEALVRLYQKGSIASKELGASQDQLFQFVENVGLALAQQGGSVQAARGALLQLSQSLGSGIVRAEEFNSILEGAFPVAVAAANGLDRAGGSVAKLRSLIINGKVTSTEFFDAILSQTSELEEAFAKTIPTIGQAFNVLSNNFTTFIGELDQSLGITSGVAQAMIALGNNLDIVAALLGTVAAGFALAFAVRIIASIKAAVFQIIALEVALGAANVQQALLSAGAKRLQAVLLLLSANPLIAIGTALAAAAVSMSLMESRAERIDRNTRELADTVSTLREEFAQAGNNAEKLANALGKASLSKQLEKVEEISGDLGNNLEFLEAKLRGFSNSVNFEDFASPLFGGTSIDVDNFNALIDSFIDGSIKLEDLRKGLDAIGAADPKFRDMAIDALELTDQTITLRDDLNRAEAVVRLLNGTATEADRKLLGMEVAARGAASGADALANSAKNAVEPMRQLINFIPELSKLADQQDDLRAARAALAQGQADLNAQNASGEIGTAELIASQDRLMATYRRAVSEIDGTAEATRDANEALADYQRQSLLGSLDTQTRQLSEARAEYDELVKSLEAAGASTMDLARAQVAYNAVKKAILDSNRTTDDPTFNGDVVADLQRQGVLLAMNNREQEVANALSAASARLKRELEPAEKRRVEQLVAENQAIRDQQSLYGQGGIIDGLKQQASLLGQTNREQELSNTLLSAAQQLGRELTETEKSLLTALVGTNQTIKDRQTLFGEGGIVADLERQAELIGMSAREQEVANALFAAAGRLGRDLTETEAGLLKMRLETNQVLKDNQALFGEGGIIEGLERQASLIGLTNRELEVSNALFSASRQLGRDLTDVEEELLKARLENIQALKDQQILFGVQGIVTQLERQAELIGLSSREQEKSNVLFSAAQRLSRDLTDAERQRLVTQVTFNQALKDQNILFGRGGVLPELERQAELLGMNNREQEVANALYSAAQRLGRDLLDTERQTIEQRVRDNQALQDRNTIYRETLPQLEREAELLGMGARQREIAAAAMQVEQRLGRELGAQERSDLETQLQRNRALEEQASILDNLRSPMEDIRADLEALNALWDQGKLTLKEYNKSLTELRLAYLETQDTFSAGIERGFLKVRESIGTLSEGIEDTFVNAFEGASDALKDFIQTGEADFRGFVASIFDDLSNLVFDQFVKKPLLDTLGGVLNEFGFNIPGLGGGGEAAQLQVAATSLTTAGASLNSAAAALSAGAGGGVGGISGIADAAEETGIFDDLTSSLGGMFDDLTSSLGNVFSNLSSSIGSLFSSLGGGSGVGGLFSSIVSGIAGGIGGAGGIGFATGGGFNVEGGGGVDSQLVAFRASPGERVDVTRPGEQGSSGGQGDVIQFNITTPDAESFKRSEPQIAARMARTIQRGRRNL